MNNESDNLDGQQPEKDKSDQLLDEVLQQWGADRTAADPHLDALQDKIKQTLRDRQSAGVDVGTTRALPPENLNAASTPQTTSTQTAKPQHSVLKRLAIAAMVLVSLGGIGTGYSWLNQDRTLSTSSSDDGLALAIDTTQLQYQQVLLDRYQEVFGDNVNWVSELDGDVNIRLAGNSSVRDQESLGSAKKPVFLSVRLVLVSLDHASDKRQWKVVRDVNLLTKQEQRVELMAKQAGSDFSIWAYPVDMDLVSIDLDCQIVAPLEIKVTTSELQKTGETAEIFSTTLDGVEYRLYQTAVRLDQSDSQRDANDIFDGEISS